jgi:sulfatase maturation enzyme AslB (radical SAM superfamily)
MERSKHFCILPWVQAHFHMNGEVSPCCRTDKARSFGSLEEKTFEEIWNGERFRDVRARLLSGEAAPECRACYDDEARGVSSMRQHALKEFRDSLVIADGRSSEPVALDLRLSNLCNFRCRTCSPEYSAAWNKDWARLGLEGASGRHRLRASREGFWPWLEGLLPHLKKIHFAGGEPLLLEDHYLLLEKLLAVGRTDLRLSYNTNLSVSGLKHWDVASLWKRFENIHVIVSLDGVGEAGALLRKGQSWAATENRYLSLRERVPHARFTILITISVMNAFHVTQALDHFLEKGMVRAPGEFGFNFLTEPRHFSLGILNLEERAELRSHYLRYLEGLRPRTAPLLFAAIESSLRSVLSELPREPMQDERRTFRKVTLKLDRIRKERFVRVFPEHLGLIFGDL